MATQPSRLKGKASKPSATKGATKTKPLAKPPAKTSAKQKAKSPAKPPAKQKAKTPAKSPAKTKGQPPTAKTKSPLKAGAKATQAKPSPQLKPSQKPATPKATANKGAGKTAGKATKKAANKAAGKTAQANKTALKAQKPATKPATAKATASKPTKPTPKAQKPATAMKAPKAPNPFQQPPKQASKQAKPPKKGSFKVGDKVVYPAHGVGQITAIKSENMEGSHIEFFVINFAKDRLVLRLPTTSIADSGLRPMSINLDSVVQTLKKPRRVKRTMWSRRAQEYETKISSGDPVSIAEVIRDLYRKPDQNEQSYSERQIYQDALERLAGEFAEVKGMSVPVASQELENILRAS